jgi:general secretion pathway protein A
VDVLNLFLLSLVSIGASAVLVIDEAQNLRPATLEQIRVLTNLETDRQKLLQVVLIGQLDLLTILGAPKMRQLDQRISRRCRLQPLSRKETESYIEHRLSVALADQAVTFVSKALDAVQQLTSGVPRMINMLCDRALECGQAAGTRKITASLVQAAAQQLALESPRRRHSDRRKAQLRRLAPRLAAAAAITGGVLVGAWQVVRYYDVPIWPAPSPLTAGVSAGTPLTSPASEYSILVGSFPTWTAAAVAMERLSTHGYVVRDLVQPEGREGYQLLVGPYTDVTVAREHAAQLQREPELTIATIVNER